MGFRAFKNALDIIITVSHQGGGKTLTERKEREKRQLSHLTAWTTPNCCYSRHILLDELGIEGQEALLSASVLMVGAGGLGSSAGLYLERRR